MGNFTFLETHWSDLARLGDLSEKVKVESMVCR